MKSNNTFEALSGIDEETELEPESKSTDGDTKTSKRHHLRKSLVWIDLEMTGLNVHEDSILQIACIVTDGSLKVIKEAGEITIHHGDDVLERMNDWCQQHHGESGLIDAVRESTVTMEEAESRILEFIEKHAEPDSPIAGNSVHVDVQFLRRLMPRITDYCHYRIVDVSTIGELCHRWYPREANSAPRKKNAHTALSDIRESIHQLRYYRSHIFK